MEENIGGYLSKHPSFEREKFDYWKERKHNFYIYQNVEVFILLKMVNILRGRNWRFINKKKE